MLKRLFPREWNGAEEQMKKKKQNSSTKNVRVPLVMSSFDLSPSRKVFFLCQIRHPWTLVSDCRTQPSSSHFHRYLVSQRVCSQSEMNKKRRQHHPNGNVAKLHVLWNLETGSGSSRKTVIKIFSLFSGGEGGLRFKRDCREISPTSPLDCRTKYLKHAEHRRRQAHTRGWCSVFRRKRQRRLTFTQLAKLSQPAPISQKASLREQEEKFHNNTKRLFRLSLKAHEISISIVTNKRAKKALKRRGLLIILSGW